MDKHQEYLTKAKYDEFNAELNSLKTTKRKEIAEALEYAKSLGDLSENAEYHEARDTQARVEDRINHLEALLKSASIVSKHDTSVIGVGSVMVLEREGSKDKKEYTIVGSEESDAARGLISMRSPLGLASLGKGKGDTFSFKSPAGPVNYKIIDIK
ncbi:MAG: grea/greb family elongation factor, transcription elongation factor GreA [Parcubacteria group bacterium]|nr:grea/greb family elongation factor, transcription elongation factor GreA [Parcubacteria group bacterium]